MCRAPSAAAHREGVLHAVAEVLLLAESDALVLGQSRFPGAALLLSHSVRRSLLVILDKACRRHAPPPSAGAPSLAPPPPNETASPYALRCVGSANAYSAVHLQDAEGRLRADRFLAYF